MKGGINLKSNKYDSRFSSIENLPVPEEVVLYTSQHIGAPSDIIVKKREKVKKGQPVAVLKGGCSASLHSPISGSVKEIARLNMCGGKSSPALVIKNEGAGEEERLEGMESPSPDQIKKRIEEAGIVGMGGAGFPTHMKLSPPKPVDIAFLNGCECEPFLTADERLMIEESRKVVEGFVLLKKAEGAKKGIIGIESDKKEAIQKITESISNYDDLEIAVLPKVYPQGYEKMLITETTGRRVPAGGLPFDAGVAVHNVSTSFAVAEAVYEGRPLMERVLTVSGDNIIEPVNFRAPLGMKVKEILSYCSRGSLENKKLDIYMGGPMMGVSLDSLEQGILKTTSGIIVGEAFSRNEAPCIKCGRCVNTCPMGLSPRMLNMFYEGRSFDNMLRRGLESCMECGCCSYICPSDISLREKFRDAKNHI